MFKNLKTAVIGTGIMGQNHARILSEISCLKTVCDSDIEQGKSVAKRHDANFVKDYEEIDAEIDAAVISVPTFLHETVAIDLISKGINVLVEKPLSNNSASCLRIVNCAKEKNKILAVGQIERFNPVIKKAKELLESEQWGEVISISARRFSNYPDRIRDVGVIFDLSIHDVDIIRYLLNSKVKSVVSSGGQLVNKNYEDYINILLKFEDGKIGLCETNWLTPRKVREISITTTTHYVIINLLNQDISISSSKQSNTDVTNLYNSPLEFETEILKVAPEEPLKNELIDFLSSVENSSTPLVSGEDGLVSVRVVEAALKSLNTNKILNF